MKNNKEDCYGKCVFCGNVIPEEDIPHTEYCSLECINNDASAGMFLDTHPCDRKSRDVKTDPSDFEI